MPHNEHFIPDKESYNNIPLKLSPFKALCQKVLPLVYDDSLSYYELLCRMIVYLNETMQAVNDMGEDYQALLQSYDKLIEYVNTYFDNLDLTEEVRQIIRELIESGEFTQLIDPLLSKQLDEKLPPIVKQDVSDKLDEMVTDGTIFNILKPHVDEKLQTELEKLQKQLEQERAEFETNIQERATNFENGVTQSNNTFQTDMGNRADTFEKSIQTKQTNFEVTINGIIEGLKSDINNENKLKYKNSDDVSFVWDNNISTMSFFTLVQEISNTNGLPPVVKQNNNRLWLVIQYLLNDSNTIVQFAYMLNELTNETFKAYRRYKKNNVWEDWTGFEQDNDNLKTNLTEIQKNVTQLTTIVTQLREQLENKNYVDYKADEINIDEITIDNNTSILININENTIGTMPRNESDGILIYFANNSKFFQLMFCNPNTAESFNQHIFIRQKNYNTEWSDWFSLQKETASIIFTLGDYSSDIDNIEMGDVKCKMLYVNQETMTGTFPREEASGLLIQYYREWNGDEPSLRLSQILFCHTNTAGQYDNYIYQRDGSYSDWLEWKGI